jgi:hypothetical protein
MPLHAAGWASASILIWVCAIDQRLNLVGEDRRSCPRCWVLDLG